MFQYIKVTGLKTRGLQCTDYRDNTGVECSCPTMALICGSLQSTEENEAEITTVPHMTKITTIP